MQPPRAVYWDEELGRLVSPDEPYWDITRFSEMVAAGCEGISERDTIPAPPPLPEEEHRP